MGLDSCLRQGLWGGGEGLRAAERGRGDIDGSGQVDISAAIGLPGYLFSEGEPPICLPVADCNRDGNVDITEPVTVLVYLFQGALISSLSVQRSWKSAWRGREQPSRLFVSR